MGYGPLTDGLNILGAALLAVQAFALFDASIRPTAAFPAVDKQTKALWTILLGVAVAWGVMPMLIYQEMVFRSAFDIIVIAGTVVALVYLLDARPAVRAAGGKGPRSGGRGGW